METGPTDADGQFLVGLQLIQQSHNRRVEELIREVEHWKRQAQAHKQQLDLSEQQAKESIMKANQQTSELRRLLSEKQQEFNSMLESRNQALSQLAQLKAQAGQLQNFKRAISAMVTDGGDLGGLSSLATTDLGNLGLGLTHESPARLDYTPINVGTSYRATTSSIPVGNGSGRISPPSAQQQQQPRATTTLGNTSTSMQQQSGGIRDAEPSRLDEPLDAAAYYQQVKEILEPQAFREFAGNIKRLNAGQQSVSETLRNVREIFGEQRPFLYSQLQRLIQQAENEARRQVEQETPGYR